MDPWTQRCGKMWEVRSGQDVKCEGFQGRVKSVRACAPHIVTLDGCACVLAVA